MKKILIVDDDPDIVAGLEECLTHIGNETKVFTAPQAEDALATLRDNDIDLLITDVHMPGMNGLELVMEAKKNNPHLAVIVVTAFPTLDIERQAMLNGCLRFIEKPFDLDDILATVRQALDDSKGFVGTVDGIDLQDLIQLHCLSNSTAAVKVTHNDETGMIFFNSGNIVHAILGDTVGEEAFYRIIAFAGGSLESNKNVKAPTVTIEVNHIALLMEGVRRLDESMGKNKSDEGDQTEADGSTLVPAESVGTNIYDRHISVLKKVLGYKAAAIMTLSGKMLASESLDEKIDLDNVAIALNDIYHEAHEAILKIGMDRCIETVIEASNGVIVMHSTGDSKDDLHVIGILSAGGNKSLMKMKMAHMMPAIKESNSH